jgi:glycosyltransferase involved in cell wall biosynthesis
VCARLCEIILAFPTRLLIAVSQDERSHLVDLGISSSKIVVIPNGVAQPSLQHLHETRARQRAALGVDDNTVCIGFVGRIERQKRVDLLIDAFADLSADALRQARLVIVGAGTERAVLEEKVRATPGLTARVHFAGEARCGAEWMSAFDAFALSSDYEGMPYVLIEALAAGLPLVSTRTGGASTLIRHGWNGFITPVADSKAFAAALEKLALRPALRRRMGYRSRIRSEAFTTRQMIAGTLAAYQQAAAVKHTFPEYSEHATVLKH